MKETMKKLKEEGVKRKEYVLTKNALEMIGGYILNQKVFRRIHYTMGDACMEDMSHGTRGTSGQQEIEGAPGKPGTNTKKI